MSVQTGFTLFALAVVCLLLWPLLEKIGQGLDWCVDWLWERAGWDP